MQTEKLASLGQLTAGIAHEIKNPLNFVNNFSSLSVELIDELQEELGKVKIERGRARRRSTELAARSKAISTRSPSTASAPMRSSRTCCCIRARARASTGRSTSTRWSRKASTLPITARGRRSRASTSCCERSFDAAAGEVDLYPQEVTRVLLNIIANGFYAAT